MITHPEKLLFPSEGISKGEVADYYEAIAPLMLPHLRGRPVTMERFPAGIEAKGFMQKDVSKGFPAFLQRAEVPKKDGTVHYPLIDDLDSLLWLANQNCITPHVFTSRVPQLAQPDVCVFDLDPAADDPGVLREAALAVRQLLTELGLSTWLKTSGSKGYHIVVPLDRTADFDTVWHFAHGVGAVLVKRHPERLTQEFLKSDRAGRILIDTGRNGYGATFAAAYSVRPKPGAPVSAPCTWQELEQGKALPQSFSLRSMKQRAEAVGELWAELAQAGHALDEAIARLAQLISPEERELAHAASTRKPKRSATSGKPRRSATRPKRS
jgi:bifunctional non-homologous end joining protein LigD